MAKDDIIDKYGFDPSNYTLVFRFHYYKVFFLSALHRKVEFHYDFETQNGDRDHRFVDMYHFTDVEGFHNGLFLLDGVCDLDYLNEGITSLISNEAAPRSFKYDWGIYYLLLHRPSRTLIVVCRDNFELYLSNGVEYGLITGSPYND